MGTLAHTFIEDALKDGTTKLSRQAPGTFGTLFTVDGHDLETDDDFIDGVNVMLDYVHSVRPNYEHMAVEVTVRLEHCFKHPPPVAMFGRCDVLLLSKGMLEIVDYKNGSGVLVDPKANPQLLYYAAGAIDMGWRTNKVRLTVVQPHARSVDKVRSVTIDILDLMIWLDEVLIPGVEACARPDAPLVTGSWCRFCPVSFACPALIAEANRMAAVEFDDERVRIEDPEELGKMLVTADRAVVWAEALRNFAVEQLQRQVRIPHWSLVPTRPVRRWRDVEAAERKVLDLLGALKVKEAFRDDLKTPAQVEKIIRKRVGNDAWETAMSPLVESHSSGVKLHHDTEPADPEFEDV